MTKELDSAKKSAIRAARELCYNDEVIKRLQNAKSLFEIDRIMISARRNKK